MLIYEKRHKRVPLLISFLLFVFVVFFNFEVFCIVVFDVLPLENLIVSEVYLVE